MYSALHVFIWGQAKTSIEFPLIVELIRFNKKQSDGHFIIL